jgi:hypothetical protein
MKKTFTTLAITCIAWVNILAQTDTTVVQEEKPKVTVSGYMKPEFRMDTADDVGIEKYYENKDGLGTSSQQTLGVAFIYKY